MLQRQKSRRVALLPEGLRVHRPLRWWHEVLILIVLDVIYERLHNLVPTQEHAAIDRSQDLFELTVRWHVDIELTLNHWLAAHPTIGRLAEFDYSFFHLTVTAAVLIWLFAFHARVYRAARTALVVLTAIALTWFYIMPMAPPRLLPHSGFIDTAVLFHSAMSWSTPTVVDHSNQFAAMPSLHCAWAFWCGVCIYALSSRVWVRVLAVAYPATTFLVVLGTANHFVLDCIAGAAVTALAFGIQRLLSGHRAFEPAPDRDEAGSRCRKRPEFASRG
ncbi:phosphatase PAP2 family protein [Leekyejoonella antrihumi]|uniref:phosphatase PAP2 family protein n=1 Tax=Leekyejoonella antrihumi TaxID=1660198 RepID=UPI001644ADBD|nr:phosphatase PAP2 family protein [Leekyejoonella antrihumi]